MKNLKSSQILIFLIFYLWVSIFLSINNSSFYISTFKPIFWSFFLIYLWYYQKKTHIPFRKNRKCFFSILMFFLFIILIYFNLGFLFGFARSPYNHSLESILKNIFYQVVPIIAIEITRKILIARNQKSSLLLFIITFFLLLLELDYTVFINLFPRKESFFQYCCSILIPMFANSLLYTYLVSHGIFPLIFRIIFQIFYLLFPVLPNLNWFLSGFLGMMIPILIYAFIQYKFTKNKKISLKKKKVCFIQIRYAFTLLFASLFVCFIMGFFPYKPIAILSNSMYPTFQRGDVVIYKKVSLKNQANIQVGDILIYEIENQIFAHRIISKDETIDCIFYQTKGDHNQIPDRLRILPEQILGVYVFHIPSIGFPSVWFHDYFHKVDTKV